MIDPDLAARLTLLYLRAAVPAESPLREDVCAVGHGTEPVSTAEAARRLAKSPKPLTCYAAMTGDLLVVELRFSERWRQAFTTTKPADDLQDEWYRQRYGEDFRDRAVLCVGRGEWLLTTFGELAEWRRDYPFLGPGGCAGDDFTEEGAAGRSVPPAAIAAAAERGAVHIQLYGPSVSDDGVVGRIRVTRYEAAQGEAPMCERCAERQARFAVHWLEGERPTRSLCQRCIDEELETYQFDEARELDRRFAEFMTAERTLTSAELAEMAEEQAMWWAVRHQPPFVREFIARHRSR
jgi:hypothetical protein